MRRSDGRRRRSSARSDGDKTEVTKNTAVTGNSIIRTRSQSKDETPTKESRFNGKKEHVDKSQNTSPRGRSRGRGRGRGQTPSPKGVQSPSLHFTRSCTGRGTKNSPPEWSDHIDSTPSQSGVSKQKGIHTENQSETSSNATPSKSKNANHQDNHSQKKHSSEKLKTEKAVSDEVSDDAVSQSHDRKQNSSMDTQGRTEKCDTEGNEQKHSDDTKDGTTENNKTGKEEQEESKSNVNCDKQTTITTQTSNEQQNDKTRKSSHEKTPETGHYPRTRRLSARQRQLSGDTHVSGKPSTKDQTVKSSVAKNEPEISPLRSSPRRGKGRPSLSNNNARLNLNSKLQSTTEGQTENLKVENGQTVKNIKEEVKEDTEVVESSSTATASIQLQTSTEDGKVGNIDVESPKDDTVENDIQENAQNASSGLKTENDSQSVADVVCCDHDYFATSQPNVVMVTKDTEDDGDEDSDIEVMEVDNENSQSDEMMTTQGNNSVNIERVDSQAIDKAEQNKKGTTHFGNDASIAKKLGNSQVSKETKTQFISQNLMSQSVTVESTANNLKLQSESVIEGKTQTKTTPTTASNRSSPRDRGRKKGTSPRRSPRSVSTVTIRNHKETANQNATLDNRLPDNGTQGMFAGSSTSAESTDFRTKILGLKRKYDSLDEEVDTQYSNKLYDASDIDDPFYFESDHAGIKGNKDYRVLMRTLVTLEAQRTHAIQDLDKLYEAQHRAQQDPIKFVERLQHKEDLGIPCAQRVVPVPNISWDKYADAVMTTAQNSLPVGHQLRSKINKQTSVSNQVEAETTPRAPTPVSAVVSTVVITEKPQTETDSKNSVVVRGRVPDGNKPPSQTFNQLWTIDEQRRLEELLVKYPMEEVEAKRWEKIARDLGNRTTKQVASRVQKYFIKLAKAGLPVPGRIPNLQYHINKSKRRQHAYSRPLFPTSTMLQSHVPPVYMPDDDGDMYCDDDDDDDDMMYFNKGEPISDDETVPESLRESEEYRELMRLKTWKRKKLHQQQFGQAQHIGYSCDGCQCEPIVGVRWHCVECPDQISVDLCENCFECGHVTDSHNNSHCMEPIHFGEATTGFIDGDYTQFRPYTGDYNYLDPNYNPAKLPS
ncbi:uncharacterized protein LOC144441339 [Glandiceps talaboti]